MAIKALIFDFDGLILDTEVPEYQSWSELYAAHGCDLPFETWAVCIGTNGAFDPYDELARRSAQPVDRTAVDTRQRARFTELLAQQALLPGVVDTLAAARRLGLKLAVASSSSRAWVTGHLTAYGLAEAFDAISCVEDVLRGKPDPALYLRSLALLGVSAHEAIAFEDSPNGILAAKRAGLYCVAVPNALTRRMAIEAADLRVESLAAVSLEALLKLCLHRPPAGLP